MRTIGSNPNVHVPHWRPALHTLESHVGTAQNWKPWCGSPGDPEATAGSYKDGLLFRHSAGNEARGARARNPTNILVKIAGLLTGVLVETLHRKVGQLLTRCPARRGEIWRWGELKTKKPLFTFTNKDGAFSQNTLSTQARMKVCDASDMTYGSPV